VDIQGDKEKPNGKLERDLKPKPKPKLATKEKGQDQNQKVVIHEQTINLI
jgi:hypothetical protein